MANQNQTTYLLIGGLVAGGLFLASKGSGLSPAGDREIQIDGGSALDIASLTDMVASAGYVVSPGLLGALDSLILSFGGGFAPNGLSLVATDVQDSQALIDQFGQAVDFRQVYFEVNGAPTGGGVAYPIASDTKRPTGDLGFDVVVLPSAQADQVAQGAAPIPNVYF